MIIARRYAGLPGAVEALRYHEVHEGWGMEIKRFVWLYGGMTLGVVVVFAMAGASMAGLNGLWMGVKIGAGLGVVALPMCLLTTSLRGVGRG